MMKPNLIAAAEIDRLDTWAKYSAPMCGSCISSCCTLPVEVKIKDLIRIGVVDEFERGDRRRTSPSACRRKASSSASTRSRDLHPAAHEQQRCLYLDRKSRLCTIYDKRPDTCRNHPKIGPRPGYCTSPSGARERDSRHIDGSDYLSIGGPHPHRTSARQIPDKQKRPRPFDRGRFHSA
jgi:Fe-S-cluster containining protein